MSAPHADRDGSGGRWQLDADEFDRVLAELDRPAQVVEPLAELARQTICGAADPADIAETAVRSETAAIEGWVD